MNLAQQQMKVDLVTANEERAMDVNDYQIGGKHYQKEYQHWDMVCDTNMPYLLGCATKYITRWRDKNGVEDLRKASHYIAKAQDNNMFMAKTELINKCVVRFSEQLEVEETSIFLTICIGHYELAQTLISELIGIELEKSEYTKG